MKPQEKQKANLNPIPHDLATLTKCLSIPVVLGGPPYTSPAFMITESVPKLWSHIAWEKQMQNSSQSVAFMSSWHPCRQHPSPVFLPRTTACITEDLSPQTTSLWHSSPWLFRSPDFVLVIRRDRLRENLFKCSIFWKVVGYPRCWVEVTHVKIL